MYVVLLPYGLLWYPQLWQLISDVRPVGIVDEEGFAARAPYQIEALLGSIAWGAIVEGVNDVEGGREAKFIFEEWAPEGVAVLDGAVDVEWSMKVFIFISWWPYNSFSTNIAS
jgi:hypothetical protein